MTKKLSNTEVVFKKLIDPETRDALQTDISKLQDIAVDDDAPATAPQSRAFSGDLASAFKRAGISTQKEGHFHSQMTLQDLVVSTSTKHIGNASIILSDGTPARIQQIVQRGIPRQPTHVDLEIQRDILSTVVKRDNWPSDLVKSGLEVLLLP